MRRKIQDVLPRFVGLNQFFRELKGPFEAVKVSGAEKRRYIAAIRQIHGFPEKWLDVEVKAFAESAKVMEVRRYRNGVRMVRFDVLRTFGMKPGDRKEPPPISLMLALDEDYEMIRYTMIYGTGRHTGGISGWVCRQSIEPSEHIPFESFHEMQRLIDTMAPSDFIIIEEVGHTRQFVQAYCDKDDDPATREDPYFELEYVLHDWIWQFAKTQRVKRPALKRLLRLYEQGGIPALQDAASWRQMFITQKHLDRE